MEPNPYAPPDSSTLTAPVSDLAEAEALRREHIGTETNIKSVGLLYYLGALGMFSIAFSSTAVSSEEQEGSVLLLVAGFAALGFAYLFIGYGLQRLRGWARIPTIIFSGLGLLAFPIGTLINGYILYKILSKQGQFVMKPDYQRIIAATPHVKYKTPLLVWILLALVIAVVIVGIYLGTQGR